MIKRKKIFKDFDYSTFTKPIDVVETNLSVLPFSLLSKFAYA